MGPKIVNMRSSVNCKIYILRFEACVSIKNGIISNPHYQCLQNLTKLNPWQWSPVAVKIVPMSEPWVITEFSAFYVGLDRSRYASKKQNKYLPWKPASFYLVKLDMQLSQTLDVLLFCIVGRISVRWVFFWMLLGGSVSLCIEYVS